MENKEIKTENSKSRPEAVADSRATSALGQAESTGTRGKSSRSLEWLFAMWTPREP